MAQPVVKEAVKNVLEAAVKGGATSTVQAATLGATGVMFVGNVVNDLNNKIQNKLYRNRATVKSEMEKQCIVVNNRLDQVKDHKKQKQQELDAVTESIQDEEKKMSTFENIENDEHTQFIVALGNTGYGKSTVLNQLYGHESKFDDNGPFATDDTDSSVTQALEHRQCNVSNIKCILVDTPGYSDTNDRDNVHFNNLESYLYGCGGVDVFILVMNGTNVRFDGNKKQMLRYYAEYFGEGFWNHLVVILTHIEGRTKETFTQHNRGQSLQNSLKTEMDINVDVPIIAMGYNDDFNVFRQNVMNAVVGISNDNDKLICNHIKSPIKQLREEKATLETIIATLDYDMQPVQLDLNVMNEEIDYLDDKMKNPEQFPLITNPKGKIAYKFGDTNTKK